MTTNWYPHPESGSYYKLENGVLLQAAMLNDRSRAENVAEVDIEMFNNPADREVYEELLLIKQQLESGEINCLHCNDTQEYEGETCPYCKWSTEQEEGESRMDFNKGN